MTSAYLYCPICDRDTVFGKTESANLICERCKVVFPDPDIILMRSAEAIEGKNACRVHEPRTHRTES